jgi:tRNA(adenine34) deaminase
MAAKKSAAYKAGRKATASKSAARKSSRPGAGGAKKKWVRTVTTDSTHPPKDLFTKSAGVVARSLASKRVSPKGPASGMRMLTYFINRAGKGLSATRRRELERAKELLHERIERDRTAKKAS